MFARRSFLAAGAITAICALAQDGGSGRWTPLANLPFPRFLGPAVVAVNRKLCRQSATWKSTIHCASLVAENDDGRIVN